MANYQEQTVNAVGLQPGTRCFKRGVCRIMVSPPYGELGWHVSVSCNSREPLWSEIRDAWYDLVPDAANRNAAMFFPPKDEYVNVHKNCFHIHEVQKDLKFCLKVSH